ncbi:DUF3606 domain-containing protein [Mitsuaria sp. CC2]|uniref:DUF3606 domain-containing protein n=1 Tax=Mitsuaria sp. CC2 TaxID=3029186 RepID=UPI003B8DF0A7
MSEEASFAAPPHDPAGEKIDIHNPAQLKSWAEKLSTTDEQIRQAVAAVGASASDVELHLKGSRATTSAEQTKRPGTS